MQFNHGISQTLNCTEFSEKYLSVLKSNTLEGYDKLLAPPNVIIERDNLPNTDHFRKVVVHMQQTTKQETKAFADKLKADLKQKGYKLKKAEIVSCNATEGSNFEVSVIFRINDYQDTFKVGVFDKAKYYVTGAPTLKMKTASPALGRVTINGKTYLKASANPLHLKKALDAIKKHLGNEAENSKLIYKQTLIAPDAQLWVLFDVTHKNSHETQQIMTNLSTAECIELD